MIIQMHWQLIGSQKSETTKFVAQNEFANLDDKDEYKKFQDWIGDVNERHPPPKFAQWLFVKEGSRHFMGTIVEE